VIGRDAENGLSTRLLVAGDTDRLAPFVEDLFAPIPVARAEDYMAAIAELAVAPAHGIILGVDPHCRRYESAVSALKRAAGEARVVLCCEPHYEALGQRMLKAGADDYVIFPPTADDLERALHIVTRKTADHWLRTTSGGVPIPTADEISRLAAILPLAATGSPHTLREIAALVASALRAESAMIVVEGATGAVGPNHAALLDRATFAQNIELGGRPIGQIRLGPSLTGAYDHRDMEKLRHYGVLLGQLVQLAGQNRHWQHLALHDDLTGLPNRRRLKMFLDDLLVRAEREQLPVTVLFFDIDDFKTYNDRFGHEAGDEIIRETAEMFVRCSRRHDLVARYGGDEFVVVFWDAERPRAAGSHHPQEVIDVLNRFRKTLREHQFERLGPQSAGLLTCSGGLARFPWQARTTAELLRSANEALRDAKRAGKNRFYLVGSIDVCPE
jgi:diguanylate cyclase (GGDEF)-like protein